MAIAVATAFSGVFALGVIFSILGSVKLQLAEKLKINDAQVGKLVFLKETQGVRLYAGWVRGEVA